MSRSKYIIKNLEQTLSKPIGNKMVKKSLEAKLKALKEEASILKTEL